jgi:hypothetical protein
VGSQDLVDAIVLAYDVEHVGQAVVVIVADVGAEEGLRDGTRRVVFVEDGEEPGENAVRQFGVGRVVNFIAGGPQNDTGMVAVAADGVARIDGGPLIKVEVVVVGGLADSPAIEHLLHHQETHAVTKVEKLLEKGDCGRFGWR